MNWHITIFDADQSRVIFSAPVPSRGEAEELAEHALEERPDVVIFLRRPCSEAYRYPGEPIDAAPINPA